MWKTSVRGPCQECPHAPDGEIPRIIMSSAANSNHRFHHTDTKVAKKKAGDDYHVAGSAMAISNLWQCLVFMWGNKSYDTRQVI